MKKYYIHHCVFVFSLLLLIISCKQNLDESSATAEKFKQYAVEAGVFDRFFIYGGGDFYKDINWNEVTDEDWEKWKNLVENARELLKVEKESLQDVEFGKAVFQQAYEEAQGKSNEERLAIYREYGKKFPRYFSFWDDPVE